MIEDEGLATDLAQKEQQNPLVLTYDGFIVDGNRRTAALRVQQVAENLTAVVLPAEAEASDVFETELALQMERQTKAEYNWVDQALHVAMGVKTLYRRKPRPEAIHAVAQRLNEPDKEIESILARLTLVDVYLEWLGEPAKYHRIPADKQSASEQAFVELATREARQQFKALPELQRRAARHACFTVISQGGGYMNIRKIVDAVRLSPAEVVARVKDELPESLSTKLDEPVETDANPATTSDSSGGDLLDDLAGSEDGGSALDGVQLLNVVSDPQHARDAAPAIVQVTDDLDEEAREARDNLEPLRKVERALKLLRDVKLSDDTQKLGDVAHRLAAIDTEAGRLADAVSRLRAAQE